MILVSITIYLPDTINASQAEYEDALKRSISHLHHVGDSYSASLVNGLLYRAFMAPEIARLRGELTQLDAEGHSVFERARAALATLGGSDG